MSGCHGHLHRKVRHLPERDRGQHDADADDQARIDAPDQPADEHMASSVPTPRGAMAMPGLQHRIAHQLLQQRRQQRQRREQHDAHHEDQDIAGEEIAVLEQRQADERAPARSACA